jgi:hypothetical protein
LSEKGDRDDVKAVWAGLDLGLDSSCLVSMLCWRLGLALDTFDPLHSSSELRQRVSRAWETGNPITALVLGDGQQPDVELRSDDASDMPPLVWESQL